jgi:AcrR family transcriptional regulator
LPASDLEVTFRQRLLDALASCISVDGYRSTTVADIVKRARTSRRTFYEHFASKEACFVALLRAKNAELIQVISASVDPTAPCGVQCRQAIEAWVACTEAEPSITVSWIRDVPALGSHARDLQRHTLGAFVVMIQELTSTPLWRSRGAAAGVGAGAAAGAGVGAGAAPVSREIAILLMGGLSELTASTVEDGGQIRDTTEVAVQACVALLMPAAPA